MVISKSPFKIKSPKNPSDFSIKTSKSGNLWQVKNPLQRGYTAPAKTTYKIAKALTKKVPLGMGLVVGAGVAGAAAIRKASKAANQEWDKALESEKKQTELQNLLNANRRKKGILK